MSSLDENEKPTVGHNEYINEEAGHNHHDMRPCPVNGGGFRDPYHYSNHEDVVYTHPRGIAYAALVFLFAGSQTPLYFMGGSLTFVVETVGGSAISSWYVIAYTLSLAAICPFTGYLSDLLSRRYVAILGQIFNCVGTILIATAHHPGQIIVGSGLAGVGAGIGEMSAQGGLGEMVPRKHRGNISALMIIGILPFCPYVLWCNMLGVHRWRDGFWVSLSYNIFDLVILLFAYWPPNEPLPEGVTRSSILSKIDWLGAFLVVSGLTVLLYALQVGEAEPWTHANVLAPFFVGVALIIAFLVWETKAALPLIPIELFKANPRVMALTFGITAIAGANFFSLTNFVPLMVSTVWDASDPVRVGLRALGSGLSTTAGAVAFAPPLSKYPKHTKYIMLIATTLMTGFVGALAAMRPDKEYLFFIISTLAGFGVGGIVVPAATIAIIASPDDLIGTVTALTLSIRACGGAIGNSIYFNVLYKEIPKAVVKEFPPRLLAAGLPASELAGFIAAYTGGNTTAIGLTPGLTPAILEAAAISTRWMYADALKQVFLVSIAFGGASIIAAGLLHNVSQFVDGNQGMDVHRTLHTHNKAHF